MQRDIRALAAHSVYTPVNTIKVYTSQTVAKLSCDVSRSGKIKE